MALGDVPVNVLILVIKFLPRYAAIARVCKNFNEISLPRGYGIGVRILHWKTLHPINPTLNGHPVFLRQDLFPPPPQMPKAAVWKGDHPLQPRLAGSNFEWESEQEKISLVPHIALLLPLFDPLSTNSITTLVVSIRKQNKFCLLVQLSIGPANVVHQDLTSYSTSIFHFAWISRRTQNSTIRTFRLVLIWL
eukprot:TRINITY_DN115342_c0_g1_i1.p1 TRINITY_DN115342_c0_g1~~TRINITY_DN115342_c0_g1_i1.p1  ORF type:complete len:192 (-),score=1.95 TRINITY_DN115342_c0_g1_i1:136-711(-)